MPECTELGFLSDVWTCGMSTSLVGLEGRKGKCFQSFTIKYDVSCGFFVDNFYQLEDIPSIPIVSLYFSDEKGLGCCHMLLCCDHVGFCP